MSPRSSRGIGVTVNVETFAESVFSADGGMLTTVLTRTGDGL